MEKVRSIVSTIASGQTEQTLLGRPVSGRGLCASNFRSWPGVDSTDDCVDPFRSVAGVGFRDTTALGVEANWNRFL
jgi:hypothetical protein